MEKNQKNQKNTIENEENEKNPLFLPKKCIFCFLTPSTPQKKKTFFRKKKQKSKNHPKSKKMTKNQFSISKNIVEHEENEKKNPLFLKKIKLQFFAPLPPRKKCLFLKNMNEKNQKHQKKSTTKSKTYFSNKPEK